MRKTKSFNIFGDKKLLFCKCVHMPNGEVQLVTKNETISLTDLQRKAYDISSMRQVREKMN